MQEDIRPSRMVFVRHAKQGARVGTRAMLQPQLDCKNAHVSQSMISSIVWITSSPEVPDNPPTVVTFVFQARWSKPFTSGDIEMIHLTQFKNWPQVTHPLVFVSFVVVLLLCFDLG